MGIGAMLGKASWTVWLGTLPFIYCPYQSRKSLIPPGRLKEEAESRKRDRVLVQ